MTGAVREWLLGLACAALAAALAQALAPEGAPRRVCRLAGGLVLLLVAVEPVLALDGAGLDSLAQDWSLDSPAAVQALEEENDLLYEAIIAERTAAYIVDEAGRLGASCQAQVECRRQDGAPLPYEAVIRGTWTQEQRQALSEWIEAQLGIPPQRQEYERVWE